MTCWSQVGPAEMRLTGTLAHAPSLLTIPWQQAVEENTSEPRTPALLAQEPAESVLVALNFGLLSATLYLVYIPNSLPQWFTTPSREDARRLDIPNSLAALGQVCE